MLKSIHSRLIITFLSLIIAIDIIFTVTLSLIISNYYSGSVKVLVKDQIGIVCNFYNNYITGSNFEKKSEDIINYFSYLPYQIQILDINSNVIKDSFEYSSEYKVDSPEVSMAFSNELGTYQFEDSNFKTTIYAIAMPLKDQNKIVGIVRFVVSLEDNIKIQNKLILITIIFAVFILCISVIISVIMANRITFPIINLTKVSKQIASGNLAAKAKVYFDDEVGNLAKNINIMVSELEKIEKLKYDFISKVSHELRTPLTSIKGWAVTLEHIPVSEYSQIKKGLLIISNESDRLCVLIEDLLIFSQVASGRLSIKKQQKDIIKVIHDTKNQLIPKLSLKNIECDIVCQDESIEFEFDPLRINQVLVNVIDNSIKNSPNGSKIVIEIIRDFINNRHVTITIKDNGFGISKEELPFLKTKFYKGSNNNSDNGLGLGLSICDEIITLHKGTLEIESAPQEGTKIIITLPLDIYNNDLQKRD